MEEMIIVDSLPDDSFVHFPITDDGIHPSFHPPDHQSLGHSQSRCESISKTAGGGIVAGSLIHVGMSAMEKAGPGCPSFTP